MYRNIKKVLILLIASILVLTMSGCFPDFGAFEDEEDYIDSFSTCYLFDKDADSDSFSFDGNLYYEDITKEFVETLDRDTYSYLMVKVKKDLKVKEIYLYFLSDQTDTLQVEFSFVSSLPSNLRGFDDPETEEVEDEDGNITEEQIDYDVINGIYKSQVHLSNDGWRSVGFNFNGAETIYEDSYLVFCFLNNTYLGKEMGLPQISFTLTGLFVRNEEE